MPTALVPAADSTSTIRLRVADKTPVAEGVVAVVLEHPDGLRLPDWTPGAHIDVVLGSHHRQYSLCGDRFDPFTYRIAVLREHAGRGGSAYVHDTLAVGDLLAIGGPRNAFPLVPSPRYLFVAGGIGITPLLPMVRTADVLGADWRLLYGGRTRASLAFLDELAPYGDRVVVRPQDEHGLLDLAGWVAQADQDTKVYCCGPAPLLAAIEAQCADRPPGFLRTERFVEKAPAAPARCTPFDVELARSGRVVTVTPDVSVLDVLRDAGTPVLSSCHRGLCGTCEVGVLDGVPDHRDSLLTDDERAAGDSMFVCVSRSRTDRLVLDL